MKKQTTVTDKVAEIDCEISKLNANMARLREGKLPKEKERDLAEAERDRLLQSDTDVDAEPLKQLRRQIWDINEELKDYDRRIELTATRKQELQAKRGEAHREQKRREREIAIGLTIASGKVVEEALAQLIEGIDKTKQQVRVIESLELECGESPDKCRRVLRALWRAIEQRINLQPTWVAKEFREHYRKPIQEVIERHLKDAGTEEADPKRAAS